MPIFRILFSAGPSMQLVLILAVVAALVVAEGAPGEPVAGVTWRLLAAFCAVALPTLFAASVSGLIARRLRTDFSAHRTLLRRFRQLRRVHVALWLLAVGGVTYGLGWAQLVRFNWHLQHVFLLDDLLILAPVLLPLVLSWAAFYEVDRAVHQGAASRDGLQSQFPTRAQYVILHLRHYLGILLAPLLGLLAVQDALELLAPDAVERGYGGPVLLVALGCLFVLFPLVLRHVWQTRPLPSGPLRDRLEATARRAGLRARDILIWNTNGMVVNAAVAGLVRRLRYVFLTDGLILQLADEEIEAVFSHEVGHVRHHHLLLRVLAIVAPLSLWMLFGEAFSQAVEGFLEWPDRQLTALAGAQLNIPTGLVLLGAMAVYVVVVFGYYSRQLEHQADLFGCRCVGSEAGRPAVATFTSALEKLASGSGTDRHARSWQHASVARRVDFLHRLERDPKCELRFQQRVRLVSSLVICTVLSPVAYQLLLG